MNEKTLALLARLGIDPKTLIYHETLPALPPVWFCDCSGDVNHVDHRHLEPVCDRCGCDNLNRVPCAACLSRGSDVR